MTGSHKSDLDVNKGLTASRARVRVGCAGWNIPRPVNASFVSQGTHLERYAQTFNSCEINSSFYRPHKPATWARWAASVPAGFQFSVKAPKSITHEAKLNCSSEVLSAFLQQIELLREKLGPLLFQLPPTLEFDHSGASKFLRLLRRSFSGDVVWEPRHSSWFDKSANDLLKEHHIARVAADPGCVPAASDPGGLSSVLYFRLHGSPRRYYSAYSQPLLKKLSSKLVQLSIQSRVWCIFDNTAAGFAIQNALQLNHNLKQPGR
jgi:uncharacterized protein YecE (DUF72 family)